MRWAGNNAVANVRVVKNVVSGNCWNCCCCCGYEWGRWKLMLWVVLRSQVLGWAGNDVAVVVRL